MMQLLRGSARAVGLHFQLCWTPFTLLANNIKTPCQKTQCRTAKQTMADMSWEPTDHTTTSEVSPDCTSPSSKAFVDSFVNELSFFGPTMSEVQLLRDAKKQTETLRRSFSSSSDTAELESASPNSKGHSKSRRHRSSPNISGSNSRSPGAEEAVPHEPVNWKTAVDPVSGRTYFYDSVTRKTQWEKVRTLSIMERLFVS
jgi:hypothetical protein